MKLKPVMLDARKNLSNDFSKESYQEIIHYFDSASSQGDTIFISEYLNLQHLDYLVAHRLMDGNASVYYKKQNAFVSNISHRLERYGGHADRFLYLPDSRPFFTVTELTGILVKGEKLLNNGHLKAYVEEAQKLQSIRKE